MAIRRAYREDALFLYVGLTVERVVFYAALVFLNLVNFTFEKVELI